MKRNTQLAILSTIFVIVACHLFTGCTQNQRAKHWGGTQTIVLPTGQKFVGVTWEETHLWYAYRAMRTNETPETVTLQEQSSWGLIQGKVVFVESK